MGVEKPSMYRHGLLHTPTHRGDFGEPSMYRHGLGTRETERSSMSHMVDVIGMMAYLDTY